MKLLNRFLIIFIRFRYPVSMPEDISNDLGLDLSNYLSFKKFIHCLIDPIHQPKKLARFMPREQAEDIFRLALRKERFQQNSLFSYHFKGGWMEFILQFDEQSRLRRLFIRHKYLKRKHEINLIHCKV